MGRELQADAVGSGDEHDPHGTTAHPATSVAEGTSRWRDPARAVALSDGVFAIIITLLILDLLLPEGQPGSLLTQLVDRWPAYVAYLSTYLLIGVVWLTHVRVFDGIRQMDDGMQWCNLAVLFTTGLLPFPTAVLAWAMSSGSPTDVRVAVGFYGAICALTTLSWLLFVRYTICHPVLLVRIPGFFKFYGDRALVGSVLYLTGALLGVVSSPLLALAIFVALPIFYAVTNEGFTIGRGRSRV